MKRFAKHSLLLGSLAILGTLGYSAQAQSLRAEVLKCEYRANPLGIDVTRPRFSWTLASKERGAVQTAYQALVSSDEDRLNHQQGDLWDTGRVSSDQSIQLEYAGKALHSRQRAYWKVRIWDKAGKASAWSKPQWFEIGLLSRADWKAKWIGAPDAEADSTTLQGAKWIWYPEGNPLEGAPKATRHIRFDFTVPQGKRVAKATLLASADDAYDATLNGKKAGGGGSWKVANSHDITSALKAGSNRLDVAVTNGEPGPAGFIGVIELRYEDGAIDRYTSGSAWQAALEANSNYKPAMEIANLGSQPWGTPTTGSESPKSPYLRREFEVEKTITKARVYVTAKGVYRLYLNGKRVGDDYFTPGWTNYHLRIQYQTYDVTSLLTQGANAIGMVLGDGWYTGHIAWGGRKQYGSAVRGMAQLELTYSDGSTETVATDGAWRGRHGAIIASDNLMGETYDARAEIPNWNSANAEAKGWNAVLTEPFGEIPVVASVGSVVRKYTEIKPLTIKEASKGSYVYDLGQNMVGWVRLKVRGKAGTSVRLRFAEMLNTDGSLYVTNLRGAKATDTYILKGDGVEEYEPYFTFHGFRYVEVTGYPGAPKKDAITGVVVTSAFTHTGEFATSNPLVNQLQHNIMWGQMGNYLEVPTDCPQRDERLGWMGDAQVFIRTACFNTDVAAFMTKWVQDVREAQAPNGGYSDVSPYLGGPGNAAPAWGDAGVIVPWTVYTFYNDTRILEKHYPSMAAWIEYIREANPDLIWANRSGSNYGDWLSINAATPPQVLSTAYFAYSTRLLAKIARVLGKTVAAEKYEALFQDIRRAFQKRFLSPDGMIQGNTQTCYLVALHFDLLPEGLRPTAASRLAKDVISKDVHLSTGFVGVGYLNPVLTHEGYSDLAYKLLLNDTFPSWGYSIRRGATTIWERWDGWTNEKGFQDPGMNSFNHYSLGSVGEWMYASVAGIDVDPNRPAFKHIVMKPHLGGGLSFAKANHDSPYGRIESDWRVENGRFIWKIRVPVNTTATVTVPAKDSSDVKEGNAPANTAKGVQLTGATAEGVVYEVGAGTYEFSAPTP